MRYIRICLFLAFSICGMASVLGQSVTKTMELNFFEFAVVNLRVKTKALTAIDNCTYKEGTLCALYEVTVDSVLYATPNQTFDLSFLMKLKYVIAPVRLGDFQTGYHITVTLRPSNSAKYFGVTRFIYDSGKVESFYHRGAYLSGLVNCTKKQSDPFVRFLLSKEADK